MMRLLPPCARWVFGLIVLTSLLSGRAEAALLWYNGDYDGRDALTNQGYGSATSAQAQVYDDFVVPVGQTYTITSVFSNNFIISGTTLPTTASVDIRQGVSAGVAGTSSFTSTSLTATVTATGRTFSLGGGQSYREYTVSVAIAPLTLSAGTYFLSVAPNVPSSYNLADYSYISTTSGANSVGQPAGNNGNSFVNGSYYNKNFVPTSDPSVEGSGTWDYSMGINGTATTSAVPEPTSALLVMAGLGLVWTGQRRRTPRS